MLRINYNFMQAMYLRELKRKICYIDKQIKGISKIIKSILIQMNKAIKLFFAKYLR